MDAALLPHVTDELRADTTAWPILEKMSEKDVPSVLKSYAYTMHRLGGAINLPGKPEEAAAWRTENLPRLYKAGVLEAPPSKPEEYGITKPDALAEGLGWNEEAGKELGAILHKHGAPKGLAQELIALHTKVMTGAGQALKTSYDEGVAALKKEHGAEYDARAEGAKRLAAEIFKTPEELSFFNGLGLGDHPGFLSVLMRLAPLAAQDSSFLKGAAGAPGSMTGEQVRAEVADIMSNPQNPKHKLYLSGDKATLAYLDELYKKAYGSGTVDVAAGITAG